MEPLQIAQKIQDKFPNAVLTITEYRDQVSVGIDKDAIVDVCRWLHDETEIKMDLLKDVCGVDYLGKRDTRFEVVYHLYSIEHRHALRLKAMVPEADPSIGSVTSIWEGANFHERECFDMFGIRFEGHPDLRRVLMPDDWEGHPLRKDYPLEGPSAEEDWPGYREVLDKADKLKEFEWNR